MWKYSIQSSDRIKSPKDKTRSHNTNLASSNDNQNNNITSPISNKILWKHSKKKLENINTITEKELISNGNIMDCNEESEKKGNNHHLVADNQINSTRELKKIEKIENKKIKLVE